jgi:hypothetical protein
VIEEIIETIEIIIIVILRKVVIILDKEMEIDLHSLTTNKEINNNLIVIIVISITNNKGQTK